LTITIPEEQVQAMVYVTGGDSSASTASGKKKTQYEVQKIEVGAAVQDEDVADVEAQNIITVGGPCANKVSAALMDISNAAPACYEDFPVEEGQGIIKMVDSGSKVALVVAGYSAADTRKAAQVLANYEDYAADLKGKSEVVVSGTKILAANVAEEE
jgi:S-layer protein (TIGR01564 family)